MYTHDDIFRKFNQFKLEQGLIFITTLYIKVLYFSLDTTN